MLIESKRLLEDILAHIPEILPETGGILGGNQGIIKVYLQDEGMPSRYGCSYAPNTERLNKEIEKWKRDKISFMGIFHTHFHGVRTLSAGDKAYIASIMNEIPSCITKLYFPIIVFPQKEIVAYAAIRNNGKITIMEDTISILDGSVNYECTKGISSEDSSGLF